MPELRILQVLPALNAGGVEHVTLDMVTALHEICPTTYVASEGGTLLPELEQRGGIHLPLPLASKNPFQMAHNAYNLARLIHSHSIQLIHARSRAPAWSALWAARRAKIPFVTTYHGAYASSNLAKVFYNSVMARGDRVIAISEFIAKHIQHHYPASFPQVRLIHEGIDTEEFNPHHISQEDILDFRKAWNIPPTAILFLLPGRITRIKGQTTFIDAIRRLSNPNVVGVILGQDQDNSSYPAEVRLQCKGLPIRLVPYMARPRVAYAAADFIVCASLAEEAFGRVTAEAGAMERVCISTNHGATVELCRHAKTGFLTPPGDARALADAMTHAIKMSPEDYQTMGKAARAYICENFSLKRMCDETIKLYKELIK